MEYYSDNESTCTINSADSDESALCILPPIRGYRRLPLVSLREAVRPLVSLVPEVKRMVKMVLEEAQDPKDGLSVDQSASIMLYTLEWMPRGKSFAVFLNEALLKYNRENLKPWLLYLRLTFSALDVLPRQQRVVYRGVKKDLRAYYPIGKTVIWWGFSSCSTESELLQHEQFCGRSGSRTVFYIECDSGVSIKNHCLSQDRQDVLLLPGTHFKVVLSADIEHGLNQIHLREIPKYFSGKQPLRTLDAAHLPMLTETPREQHPIVPSMPLEHALGHSVSLV